MSRGDEIGAGGGIYWLHDFCTASRNLIEENEASWGGAIYYASPKLAEGNIIRRNKGIDGAGGVEGAYGIWKNNIISENTTIAGKAAGFRASWRAKYPFHFVGNVVTGNSGGGAGGMYLAAILAEPGADFSFSNCIFRDNAGTKAKDLEVRLLSSTPGWTPTHSILSGFPGDGNLDVDPLFVDAEPGDFRLREDSPAIDAGAAFPGFDQDFAGAPRPFRALLWGRRGDGSGVDIGAFEYQTAIPAPLPAAGNAWVMR